MDPKNLPIYKEEPQTTKEDYTRNVVKNIDNVMFIAVSYSEKEGYYPKRLFGKKKDEFDQIIYSQIDRGCHWKDAVKNLDLSEQHMNAILTYYENRLAALVNRN